MRISRGFIYLLIIAFTFGQISPAFAGIVGTERFLSEQNIEQDRENLRILMTRDEVRSLLEKNGLTVEQAQERVNSLTESEVRQLASKYEELPAAGDAWVIVIILALVVVILELAGITDIFTAL